MGFSKASLHTGICPDKLVSFFTITRNSALILTNGKLRAFKRSGHKLIALISVHFERLVLERKAFVWNRTW